MPLTQKQKIGQIGENIAVRHLKKLGFKILDRNYRKKWGEIDIVAEIDKAGSIFQKFLHPKKILHFIEVKSVSVEKASLSVSAETFQQQEFSNKFRIESQLTEKVKDKMNVSQVPQKSSFQIAKQNVSAETFTPLETHTKTSRNQEFKAKPPYGSPSPITENNAKFLTGLMPEENIHFWKKRRLAKTINTYLAEKNISQDIDWQIDAIAIFINLKDKNAKIRFTENV